MRVQFSANPKIQFSKPQERVCSSTNKREFDPALTGQLQAVFNKAVADDPLKRAVMGSTHPQIQIHIKPESPEVLPVGYEGDRTRGLAVTVSAKKTLMQSHQWGGDSFEERHPYAVESEVILVRNPEPDSKGWHQFTFEKLLADTPDAKSLRGRFFNAVMRQVAMVDSMMKAAQTSVSGSLPA
jgi:hypothetical protein